MSREGIRAAEQGVLGSVINRPEVLGELWLEPADFAELRHQVVFAAMRNMAALGQAIDVTTLAARLEQEGRIDSVGGIAYLGELALAAPLIDNAQEYAAIVKDESLRRRVVEAAGNTLARNRDGGLTGQELLDEALGSLTRLDADQVTDDTQSISDLTREHVRWLEEEARRRAQGHVQLTGYTTGVADLDALIGGWQPGIAQIVAGRPGHGKSSLLLASAIAITANEDDGVHVFSMEDPRRMYMNRVLAQISGIPLSRISTGDLTRGDLPEFTRASIELTKRMRHWLVDDRSAIAADDIVRSVRRHRRKNKTKVVFVDYIQLVKRSRNSLAKSRHEALGESFHELADASKNDGIAYVIGCQLNRDVEKRDDKRPQPVDLRESGTLEERAKAIIALYRGAKYYPHPQHDIDTEYDGTTMTSDRFLSTVQLLVLKNSQGPAPERAIANWHGETTRIW